MNKRKNEISILNVLLCLIVVLVHLAAKPLASLGLETFLFKPYTALWRIGTFATQGFIFISAVKTFLGNRRENPVQFMLKRIKTVIIPYVIVVCIYYLYFVFVLRYFPFSLKDLAGYIVRGDVAAQFYFVIIILQFYLLYPLWCKILDKVKPIYAIVTSVIINVLFGLYLIFIVNALTGHDSFHSYDKFFTTYIMYWIGGMYVGKYYDKFIEFIKKRGALICVITVIVSIVDITLFLLMKYDYVSPVHLDAVHSVYCVLMIMATYFVSYKLRDMKNILITLTDRASYYIYLFHILFISVVDFIFKKIGLELGSVTLSFIVRSVIVYGICLLLAVVYSHITKPKTKKVI